MLEDRSFTMKDYMPELAVQINFNLNELKEYYKTIKNNADVPDSYKLKIANTIIAL